MLNDASQINAPRLRRRRRRRRRRGRRAPSKTSAQIKEKYLLVFTNFKHFYEKMTMNDVKPINIPLSHYRRHRLRLRHRPRRRLPTKPSIQNKQKV